jgi:TPR repeat protein
MSFSSPPMAGGTAIACILFLLFVSLESDFAMAEPAETEAEALSRYEKEYADTKLHAEQGDPQSQYQWGLDCIYRQRGSKEEGLHWLLLASAQGNADAEAETGTCYGYGLGTAVNAVESIRLLRDAASKGNANALHYLGLFSIGGLGPLPKDLHQAEKYLIEAVKKGSTGAEDHLASVRNLLKKENPSPSDGKTSP